MDVKEEEEEYISEDEQGHREFEDLENEIKLETAEPTREVPRMTANLANLKEVCETFEIDQYDSNNVEKRWKAWLENFEICTEYEGIDDPKKRRAALLAVAGPQLRELHGTLEEGDEKTYDTVRTVFNAYFKGKKNLTAERYKC